MPPWWFVFMMGAIVGGTVMRVAIYARERVIRTAEYLRTPEPTETWRMKGVGPWPMDPVVLVRIEAVQDGYVRYRTSSIGSRFVMGSDSRDRVEFFIERYEPESPR